MSSRVAILGARCSSNATGFGIRIERQSERESAWNLTWAFALSDSLAQKEGYDHMRLQGEFQFGRSYPGCPHCKSISLFRCSCSRATCWNGESRTVRCPWCGVTGEIGGEVTELHASGDA